MCYFLVDFYLTEVFCFVTLSACKKHLHAVRSSYSNPSLSSKERKQKVGISICWWHFKLELSVTVPLQHLPHFLFYRSHVCFWIFK